MLWLYSQNRTLTKCQKRHGTNPTHHPFFPQKKVTLTFYAIYRSCKQRGEMMNTERNTAASNQQIAQR